jgi:hypothetical protein
MWQSFVSRLGVPAFIDYVWKYSTWSVVVFLFAVPLALAIVSLLVDGVFQLSKGVASMGIRKMAVASARVGGVWKSASGDYDAIADELTKLGYVRGGSHIEDEYWVIQGLGGGSPIVRVTTFSDSIRSIRDGRSSRYKVGPVK